MRTTLIVYHSDHGDMAGEHDLWMKRCHYEASARIPAIVSWPGRAAGRGDVRPRGQRARP